MKKYKAMYIGQDNFQIHISEDAIRYAYRSVSNLEELIQQVCTYYLTNQHPNKIVLFDVIGGKIQ